VKEFFDREYRDKVMAKNKGEIEIYFVDRIRDVQYWGRRQRAKS
jgi:hypothetical protein